jgi:CBS domain-containing protein
MSGIPACQVAPGETIRRDPQAFSTRRRRDMKVEEMLSPKGLDVITIHPDQSLKEAVVLLVQHDIGALAVVDADEKVVGMISERDIMREVARHGGNIRAAVGEVMTSHVVTAALHDDLKAVIATMSRLHFRHMPVLADGQLVGILSIRDVVKAQLDEYESQLANMHAQGNAAG